MTTSTESTAPRPEQVQAGEYEVVAVNLDVVTSKLGEPFDYKRYFPGDKVYLDAAEARRHLAAGSVVEPGAREKAALAKAKADYEAALAALPPALREAMEAGEKPARRRRPRAVPSTPPGVPAPEPEDDDEDEEVDDSAGDGASEGDDTGGEQPPADGTPERPKRAESKPAWVDYAEARGYLAREAAEAMTKDELVEHVYAREGVGS